MSPVPPAPDEATALRWAIRDDALPEVAALLGPDAGEIVDGALPPPPGSEPIRLRRVAWQAGRTITCLFERPQRDATAAPQSIVAEADRDPASGTISGIRLWKGRDDPVLTGLRQALDGPALEDWLDTLDVARGPVERRLLVHRPRRRAVIEVRRGGERLFLKVVRPSAVAGIRDRHRELAGRLPVPTILGTSEDLGLVVLQALDGTSLFDAVINGRRPSAQVITEVISRIRACPPIARTASSAIDRVPEHVAALSLLLPDEAMRLAAIADAIGPDPQPVGTVVHGDLHPGQILVADEHVTGILDLDTMAMGRRGDDPANVLAHLASIAAGGNGGSPAWRIESIRFAVALQARLDEDHDPADLRLRTAAALLGLAAGQFQSQHPAWPARIRDLISAAESWLASSMAVRSPIDPSMSVSSPAP